MTDRVAKLMCQFDYLLTFLQRVIKSHDINIWLSCVLTSQRFLICDPLFKTSVFNKVSELHTSSSHPRQLRSKKEMARYFGTALFARVCMWGFGVYVAMEPSYQTAEYQKTVQNNAVNGKMNTSKGIIGLTNDKNLPSLETVQKLLKRSITSLSDPIYLTLVSILLDCWAMQKYAQPLHFEERRSSGKSGGNSEPDEDEDDSECDSEEEARKLVRKSIGKSDFSAYQRASMNTLSATGTPTMSSGDNNGGDDKTISLPFNPSFSGYKIQTDMTTKTTTSSPSSSSSSSSSSTSSSSSSSSTSGAHSPLKGSGIDGRTSNNKDGKNRREGAKDSVKTRAATASSDIASNKRQQDDSNNTKTSKAVKINNGKKRLVVAKKTTSETDEDAEF